VVIFISVIFATERIFIISVFFLASASNRKEAAHQQHHSAEADMESAQAVKTLLQLQDTAGDDYSTLPGLSAAYSQDSPHPTLSLVPRPVPTLSQDHSVSASEYPNRTYPNPSFSTTPSTGEQKHYAPVGAVPPVTSASPVTSTTATDAYSMPPKPSLYRPQQVGIPPQSFALPLGNPHLDSVPGGHMPKEQAPEALQKHAASSNVSKENYTVSVSIANSVGGKIAKGKTVPIPLDPDHSIPSSYAGTAALSKDKKIKRKKKPEGKSSGSPEPSPSNEVAYTPLHEPLRNQHPSPETVPFSSTGPNIAPTMSMHPIGGPPKPQSVPGSDSSTSGQPIDPNRRMHSQHHFGGSRKVHAFISPDVSSQTSNISTTGTFYPHPDPHKPQTAVSAQAQDRIRSSRPSSPNPCVNKNNNNKLASIPSRSQTTPVSKPRPSSALASPQTEKPACQEQESFASRPRHQDIKTSNQLREASLNQMQNQVEHTIVSTYSKELLAGRPKPTSPASIPGVTRPRNSPVVTREPVIAVVDPHPRSVVPNEESKTAPQKGISRSGVARSAPENPPASMSPRPKSIANIQHLSPQQQQQAAYMSQLYRYGMGFVPAMDPTAAAAVIQAQYMSDPTTFR